MDKERKVIEPGTIIYFDRNVEGKELRDLSKESLIIVINGDLTLKEDFYFEGDLYVLGNISGDRDIFIEGSLWCNGEVKVKNIAIKGDFEIHNDLDAYDISVDGDFYAKSSYMDTSKIRVEGCFYADQIDSTSVCVGGDFSCESIGAHGNEIEIAGDFECTYGGVFAGRVTVLGKLRVEGNMEADIIEVGY